MARWRVGLPRQAWRVACHFVSYMFCVHSFCATFYLYAYQYSRYPGSWTHGRLCYVGHTWHRLGLSTYWNNVTWMAVYFEKSAVRVAFLPRPIVCSSRLPVAGAPSIVLSSRPASFQGAEEFSMSAMSTPPPGTYELFGNYVGPDVVEQIFQ